MTTNLIVTSPAKERLTALAGEGSEVESGSGLVTDLTQLVLHQISWVQRLILGREDAGGEIHVVGRAVICRAGAGGKIISDWRSEGYNFLTEMGWGQAWPGCAKPRPNPAFQSPPPGSVWLRGVSAQSARQQPNIWFLSSGWIFSVSCIQICWPHQADKSESRCQVFNRFLRLITISIHLYYKLIVVTFNSCL